MAGRGLPVGQDEALEQLAQVDSVPRQVQGLPQLQAAVVEQLGDLAVHAPGGQLDGPQLVEDLRIGTPPHALDAQLEHLADAEHGRQGIAEVVRGARQERLLLPFEGAQRRDVAERHHGDGRPIRRAEGGAAGQHRRLQPGRGVAHHELLPPCCAPRTNARARERARPRPRDPRPPRGGPQGAGGP